MSIASEKERTYREKIKNSLRSKTALPQEKTLNLEKEPILKAKSAPKAEISTSTRIAEERLPILQLPRPMLPAIKPKALVYEGPKETSRERVKPPTLEAIRASGMVKLELKPKVLKTRAIETQESSEVHVSIKELPKEEINASLKPLRSIVPKKLESGSISVPIVKLPQIGIKPMRPMTPRPIKEVEEVTAGEVRSMTEITAKGSSGSIKEEVFVPPLLEELSSIASPIGRPVCIVLSKKEGDSFVESTATICREIYRIVKGGNPTPRWISKGLKEEIEGNLRAEGMIFVIDDSKCGLLPNLSNIRSCKDFLDRVDMDMILDRLRELFSQDFGFIIFHINERWAGQFANLLREKARSAKIIEIQAPEWEQKDKATLSKICWGFVEGEGETFDEMFECCWKNFSDELTKVGGNLELSLHVEKDGSASPEHESLKLAVIECLAEELGAKEKAIEMLKRGKIKTEYELKGGRADIYVPSQQRFVEIETFYGTGDPIIDKLKEKTLRKYLSSEYEGSRIDIVLLTGIQALLYARKLVNLAELYRKEYGLEVSFYLPNLRERKLIPLEEVFKMLRGIKGSSKPAGLSEDDIKRLWEEFSEALRKNGVSLEEAEKERLFNFMIVRWKSYEENRRWMLEEVKYLKERT
jgi:hypothetical protein